MRALMGVQGSWTTFNHTGSKEKYQRHEKEHVRRSGACAAHQYSQLIGHNYRHNLSAHATSHLWRSDLPLQRYTVMHHIWWILTFMANELRPISDRSAWVAIGQLCLPGLRSRSFFLLQNWAILAAFVCFSCLQCPSTEKQESLWRELWFCEEKIFWSAWFVIFGTPHHRISTSKSLLSSRCDVSPDFIKILYFFPIRINCSCMG